MPKNVVVFTGTCRFQLTLGFTQCEPQVLYAELPNGRAFLTFTAGSNAFTVSGNGDRQPNLGNFYQTVDTFRVSEGANIVAEDAGLDGVCHFSMSQDGTKFFFIKCDVYDGSKGSFHALYLEDIESFKIETY